MRGLLPPTPSGTPPGRPRGARLRVRSPGEAGQRQGSFLRNDGYFPISISTQMRDGDGEISK
eukprot:925032-Pyramimonas_sp.AAC.1